MASHRFNENMDGGTYNLRLFDDDGSVNELGRSSWLDVKMKSCDLAAMEEGVRGSSCVIAIVTDNGLVLLAVDADRAISDSRA